MLFLSALSFFCYLCFNSQFSGSSQKNTRAYECPRTEEREYFEPSAGVYFTNILLYFLPQFLLSQRLLLYDIRRKLNKCFVTAAIKFQFM